MALITQSCDVREEQAIHFGPSPDDGELEANEMHGKRNQEDTK